MSTQELDTKINTKDLEGIIQQTTKLLMKHCGIGVITSDTSAKVIADLHQCLEDKDKLLKEKDDIILEAELKIKGHAEMSEGLIKKIKDLEAQLEKKPNIDIKADMKPLEEKIKEQAITITNLENTLQETAEASSNTQDAYTQENNELKTKVKSLEEQLSKYDKIKGLLQG